MYKNELAIVSIKPSLAYGSQGRKPDIPADSRITYLFGLLHFEKQKDISEMTWAQVRNMLCDLYQLHFEVMCKLESAPTYFCYAKLVG